MQVCQTGTDLLAQNTSDWQWRRKGRTQNQRAAQTSGRTVLQKPRFDGGHCHDLLNTFTKHDADGLPGIG